MSGTASGTRAVINLLTLGVVVVFNGLAGAGTLSGTSIGEVAERYPSYFLPAGYVFGIWGVIYLLLAAFVVFQLLPAGRRSPSAQRLGWYWVLNGALNVAWLLSFSFEQFWLAFVLMLGLLLNLVAIHARIRPRGVRLSMVEVALVELPFAVYLAWISVATISNVSQLLGYLNWEGLGISGPVWAVTMMGMATLLAGVLETRRGIVAFGLVVAWALWGIGVRYSHVPSILTAATVLAPVCLVLGVLGLAVRVRQRRVLDEAA